jgi:Transglutaminase-like superfamily
MAMPQARRPRWRRWLVARGTVAVARLLALLPPRRIRACLKRIRIGAAPASVEQAQAARDAVVAVSRRCAGEYCLQRALATALLCRVGGTWPTWCAGVRVDPFQAHAWVEVDTVPVGEPYPVGYFVPVLTVAPRPAKV